MKVINELTGLRGMAALFVILNHFLLVVPALRQSSINDGLQMCGVMGMSLFFILSGFVIYYNYAEKIHQNPKTEIVKFFIARFARLYPLYFLFIIGFFIYNCFTQPSTIASNFTALPTFLVGMQSWVYGFINNTPLIYLQGNSNISWSIATEFALYLFFVPLTLFVFKSKKLKWIMALFAIAFFGRLFWYYVVYNPAVASVFAKVFGVHKDYEPWLWLTYHSPYIRLLEFLSGCAMAQYFMYAKDKNKLTPFFIFLALAGVSGLIATAAGVFHIPFSMHFLIAPFMMLVVFAITRFGCKPLTTKPLIFIGEVSYSTYLLHIIFVSVFKYDGHHLISYVLNIGGFVICTYFFAWLSYKFIEMPARIKVRNFLLTGFGYNSNKNMPEPSTIKTEINLEKVEVR